MTNRNDVAAPDENVSLAERDPPFHDLRRPRHDEQRAAVLLQLGVLMGLSGVFDGQRMKIELGLDAPQQRLAGFEQTDPDDMTVLPGPPAGVVDGNIGYAAAERIDAGSDHTGLVGWFRQSGDRRIHGRAPRWLDFRLRGAGS